MNDDGYKGYIISDVSLIYYIEQLHDEKYGYLMHEGYIMALCSAAVCVVGLLAVWFDVFSIFSPGWYWGFTAIGLIGSMIGVGWADNSFGFGGHRSSVEYVVNRYFKKNSIALRYEDIAGASDDALNALTSHNVFAHWRPLTDEDIVALDQKIVEFNNSCLIEEWRNHLNYVSTTPNAKIRQELKDRLEQQMLHMKQFNDRFAKQKNDHENNTQTILVKKMLESHHVNSKPEYVDNDETSDDLNKLKI